MSRFSLPRLFWSTLLMTPCAQAASDADRVAALIDGLVFFGGLIALAIYAAVMRVRDVRAGHDIEERRVRMRRRLPWVMGGMFGLVFYIVLRV
jgi:hypothetical protein